MDSLSLGKGDGRPVNWSHPMNNSTHLPPKSPGYSMFGSGSSIFENSGGFNLHSSLPLRGGLHKRTPSAGYLSPSQPSWLEEILESPDGDVVVKKGSHRRSSSDSVAFLDTPPDFVNFADFVTEHDEYVVQDAPPTLSRPNHRRGVSADYGRSTSTYEAPPTHRPAHRRGMSADYNNRLDQEQLFSVLSEMEPFQRPQARHGAENLALRGTVVTNMVRPSSSGDSWERNLERNMERNSERNLERNPEKGKKHVTLAVPSFLYDAGQERGRHQKSSVSTPENRSTASESNSHSDDSNDELRFGANGRYRSEPEVQSLGEGDWSLQNTHGDHLTASEQLDPSLDPKKAKRILANRQSAQRSRVRKLQYISELERSVNALQTEVSTLSPQVGFYDHRRALLTAENVRLKQKLAALAQTQRFKEAHNEALKKDLTKLLQLYAQQNQPSQQQHIQHGPLPPLSPRAYDIQQQQFSKLDLGPAIPKPKSPDVYASGPGKMSSGLPSSLYSTGVVSASHSRNTNNVIRPPSHVVKGVLPSSCMGPNSGKNLEGRMMVGTGGMPSDFMVHNS